MWIYKKIMEAINDYLKRRADRRAINLRLYKKYLWYRKNQVTHLKLIINLELTSYEYHLLKGGNATEKAENLIKMFNLV